MNILPYQKVIPKIQRLISMCRSANIPIFYTQAIREPSGIDLLTHTHRILPRSREERIKRSICVRGNMRRRNSRRSSTRPKNDHVMIKEKIQHFIIPKLRFGSEVLEQIH